MAVLSGESPPIPSRGEKQCKIGRGKKRGGGGGGSRREKQRKVGGEVKRGVARTPDRRGGNSLDKKVSASERPPLALYNIPQPLRRVEENDLPPRGRPKPWSEFFRQYQVAPRYRWFHAGSRNLVEGNGFATEKDEENEGGTPSGGTD